MSFKSFRIYIPSFASRYSIQLMLIALPWMMQARQVPTVDISLALAFFYAGSIASAIFGYRMLGGWNLSVTLRAIMVCLGIVSVACLHVDNPDVILLWRTLQGLLTGLLRPLNQIWLFSMLDKSASPMEQARRSAISQVFIALGTVIASYFGAKIGSKGQVPWLIEGACLFPAFLGAFLTPHTPHKIAKQSPGKPGAWIGSGLRFAKNSPMARTAIGVYFLNMAIFKLWTIAYPMGVRASGPNIVLYLPAILTVAPIGFMLGQLMLGIFPASLREIHVARRILIGSGITQALGLAVAVAIPQSWVAAVIVCLFGGVLAATIYPAMQRIIAEETSKLDGSLKSAVQLLVSLAADLGQVLGAAVIGLNTESWVAPTAMAAIAVITAIPWISIHWKDIPSPVVARYLDTPNG